MSLVFPFPLHPVSLGCVTFGREIDVAQSFVMMDHARNRGITFFDTAAAYADGASEQIVGQWLASRRPDPGSIQIATKMLPPYTPSRIAESVAQSRRRLGLHQLDVLFLHRWHETAETDAALHALGGCVDCGDVTSLGISNINADQLDRLLRRQQELQLPGFQIVQNNNNFAVRDVDAALRRICESHGIAIISYSPLGAGFLTGKHRDGAATGTRFTLIPGHQDVYFQPEAFQRLAHLQGVAAKMNQPLAHVALAWALHQPGIDSVLIGGRSIQHLDQAFEALAFDARELFDHLNDHPTPPTILPQRNPCRSLRARSPGR